MCPNENNKQFETEGRGHKPVLGRCGNSFKIELVLVFLNRNLGHLFCPFFRNLLFTPFLQGVLLS